MHLKTIFFPNGPSLVGKLGMRFNRGDPGIVLSPVMTQSTEDFCAALGLHIFLPQTWSELIRIKSIFENDYTGEL